jgi:hypothetical protein
LKGDLGHRALVVRRIALADPKRMGDQNRCVPDDLRKNGMRDDLRDPKKDAMKKDAMKKDDQNHYVPDDPKKDAKKRDAKKMDDQNHYVPDDPLLSEWKVGNPDDRRAMLVGVHPRLHAK